MYPMKQFSTVSSGWTFYAFSESRLGRKKKVLKVSKLPHAVLVMTSEFKVYWEKKKKRVRALLLH